MINDPGDELAPLGDTIAVALEKIFGEPMGMILIVVPAKGGKLDATTNMDTENYVAVLQSVVRQMQAGTYDTVAHEDLKQ